MLQICSNATTLNTPPVRMISAEELLNIQSIKLDREVTQLASERENN